MHLGGSTPGRGRSASLRRSGRAESGSVRPSAVMTGARRIAYRSLGARRAHRSDPPVERRRPGLPTREWRDRAGVITSQEPVHQVTGLSIRRRSRGRRTALSCGDEHHLDDRGTSVARGRAVGAAGRARNAASMMSRVRPSLLGSTILRSKDFLRGRSVSSRRYAAAASATRCEGELSHRRQGLSVPLRPSVSSENRNSTGETKGNH